MNRQEEPWQEAKNFFGETSDLQKFIEKNAQKFEAITLEEEQVLILLAKGETKSQILQQLHIANPIFKKYQNSLQAKLQAKTQIDYIKFALAFGLIPF